MNACNIFQLQRLSVNDGDGIRTTVFFKGCHLRCRWCANPESWKFEQQLMFLPHKCVNCGRCVDICSDGACVRGDDGKVRFISAHCRLCKKCAPACPVQARQLMGKPMTVEEVLSEVKKDYLFYMESHGGVTFSGGEPYLHADYLRQLTRGCHNLGITTCTESCGFFDFEACKDIISQTDELFFDIKVMDPQRHTAYTGQNNAVILENIRKASSINENIIIRTPVIEGVNDDISNMRSMCTFLKEKTSIRKIELLTYHKLGVEKMTALGLPAAVFHEPTKRRLEELKAVISSFGLENVSFK